MTRRRVLLICIPICLTFAGLLIPDCHWRLIGWARSENFYRGRPTSWWSKSLAGELRPNEPSSIQKLENQVREYPGLKQPDRLKLSDLLEDPAAFPVLTDLLQVADEDADEGADEGAGMKIALALIDRSDNPKATYPAVGRFFGKYLKNSRLEVRIESALAVAFLDPQNKDCVAPLLEAVEYAKNKSSDVVYLCIMCLACLGENGKAAIPVLRELSRDDSAPETGVWKHANRDPLRKLWSYSQNINPDALDLEKPPLGPTVGEAATQALKRIEGKTPIR